MKSSVRSSLRMNRRPVTAIFEAAKGSSVSPLIPPDRSRSQLQADTVQDKRRHRGFRFGLEGRVGKVLPGQRLDLHRKVRVMLGGCPNRENEMDRIDTSHLACRDPVFDHLTFSATKRFRSVCRIGNICGAPCITSLANNFELPETWQTFRSSGEYSSQFLRRLPSD